MSLFKEDPYIRRNLSHPPKVPLEAQPLLWEGVIFGDYWICEDGRVFKKSGEQMPIKPHHTGYPRVSIIKNGKSTSLNIHNLMAYTFKPIPSKLIPAIDHLNGVKDDYRLDNFEFVGIAENTRRAYEEGLNRNSQPVAAYNSEGEMVECFYSVAAALEEMQSRGLRTRASLKSIINGQSRRKKAYGYKWQKVTWETFDEFRENKDQTRKRSDDLNTV